MASWFKNKHGSSGDPKKKKKMGLETIMDNAWRRLKLLKDENQSPGSSCHSSDSGGGQGSGSLRALRLLPPPLDCNEDGYSLVQQPHPLPCAPPNPTSSFASSARRDLNYLPSVSLSPLSSSGGNVLSSYVDPEDDVDVLLGYESDSASNDIHSRDNLVAGPRGESFHVLPHQNRRSCDDFGLAAGPRGESFQVLTNRDRHSCDDFRKFSAGLLHRPSNTISRDKHSQPGSPPLQNQLSPKRALRHLHRISAEEFAYNQQVLNQRRLTNANQSCGNSAHRLPRQGLNSGHHGIISISAEAARPLLSQQDTQSPENSISLSPIGRSPGPSSRTQSRAISPLQSRASGLVSDQSISFGKNGPPVVAHPLPLPPSSSQGPSHGPVQPIPWSPGQLKNTAILTTGWQKGVLIGSGTFGQVYAGFHSETGEMCAIKEVHLIPDDERSMESAKQLTQEISLLSQMKHPNIVQYYGSETIEDRLYIYLEYMSGGSIHKLLQQYGAISESCIKGYTRQILSGLAYLHSNKTVHRDIKGANILVDKGVVVKLADFGMAKHISAQACPLSFKGSPYWMAPEVIQNKNGYDFAVDIWSLGCTILEMATGKPPWSQFEGIAAMFKIGNTTEIPEIPNFLSDDAKNFLRSCLQRNSSDRPTAHQLLEHPFVRLEPPEKVMANIQTLNISDRRIMPTSASNSHLQFGSAYQSYDIRQSSSNASNMNLGCSSPTGGQFIPSGGVQYPTKSFQVSR